MSLRKSPTRTPALLAANRANAQKSTGPRTARGKAQITLNPLKHGGYAGRLFRSNLLRAREDVALYDWMYRQICDNFRPVGKPQWAQAQRLARKAWCGCRRARQEGLRSGRRPPTSSSVWCLLRIPTCLGGFGTNPLYAVQSMDSRVTFPLRIRIVVPQSGIRLQFWARSRRMVWPRLPLMGLSDFPAHLDARVLVKKALEAALEASSQADWLGLLPAAWPWEGVLPAGYREARHGEKGSARAPG